MENNLIKEEIKLESIFTEIKGLIVSSRERVYATVNTEMLNLYWNIGRIILDIQKGKERADYGEEVLEKLSVKLTKEFGRGFSTRNLERMRKFYCYFPKSTTLSSELSLSHYLELIKVEEEAKRNFYMHEAINARWSVRELQRQKNSLLYERLILSKDKKGVLELSMEGQILKTSKDLVKDPFVLEFLDIKENTKYHEVDIEKRNIKSLKRIFTRTW